MQTHALRPLRLALVGVVVALTLGLVAMHQLRSDAVPAEHTSTMSVSSSGPAGQHAEHPVLHPGLHPAQGTPVSTQVSAPAMECALAAGCLLLLVLTVLRPAHRLGSGRELATRRIRGPGRGRIGSLPRLRARSPSRLELGVCRT